MNLIVLKNYWIVAVSSGSVAHWSIASTKRQSIENFLDGAPSSAWEKARRLGAKCIRMNITFQPVPPSPAKTTTPEPENWYANPGNSGNVDF